jgi:hypothetical protein
MPGVVRPPCGELLRIADILDQVIAQYLTALRSAAAVGRWEAPQEGFALASLLIRNVEAVIGMARNDEVLVTAAWSNARVSFELSARIVWMLQPDDRYEAECRWLAFLSEYETVERRFAREIPHDADRHVRRAETIGSLREKVISVLPSGYQPARMPNFRDMLRALNSPEMYRVYQEGSQYVHGGMYASAKYRALESEPILGEFTSTIDWILPTRLCWLSLREAIRCLLIRLGVPQEARPNWNELNKNADTAFRTLASYAVRSGKQSSGI